MIDQRASDIGDPVERLRYLRKAMDVPRPVARERAPRRHGRIPARVLLALVPIGVIALTPRPTGTAETLVRERGLTIPRADGAQAAAWGSVPRIWMVENSETTEIYSNGLRIDRTFLVNNRPRAAFPVFPLTGGSTPVTMRSTPAGIVYHTSESLLAPFDEQDNRRLRQLGRNLLDVVREERAYHYVIDRFGRVFAVVADTDAADHAGHSVWADADGIYVNLNDSFLAVSFEGQTGAPDAITPAQIASAKVLTQMLRSRYSIPADNCVTHAQVSVNPLNMRIGAHTDWGGSFPFAQVGLPDNYSMPLASIYAFGFEFDNAFIERTNGWKGLYAAAEQVDRRAAYEHVPAARYRAMLQHRYKEIAAEIKEQKETEGDNP